MSASDSFVGLTRVVNTLTGAPSDPLTLDPQAGTITSNDTARPTGEQSVLAGVPLFAGPIVILFNADVLGFAFDVGYFNSAGTVEVKAYARDGTLLGTWTAEETPGAVGPYTAAWDVGGRYEAFCLVRDTTPPNVAGFTVTTTDSPGVAIRNLRTTNTPVL